jgi:hypothetical protein
MRKEEDRDGGKCSVVVYRTAAIHIIYPFELAVLGAQVWDFQLLRFSWFLHHNKGRLWGKIKKNYLIFGCSFRAVKFLTRMLAQSNFKEDFFLCGPEKILQSVWGHLLVSITIFAVLGYWKYWIPYAHAPTFMCTLSNQPGTGAHPDHMHQFLDVRFHAFIAVQHCRSTLIHRQPIEIVPFLCLSTLGYKYLVKSLL